MKFSTSSFVSLAIALQAISCSCAGEIPASGGPLVALIQDAGGKAGIIGTATLRFNPDQSFLFALDLNGLPEDGVAVITDGTSCDDISEIPYTDASNGGSDFDGMMNTYQALDEGISKSAFRFNNGYNSNQNLGKTVLLYSKSDLSTVLACGVLEPEVEKTVLAADMGVYPGYTGSLSPSGRVKVTFRDDDSFQFRFRLSGLEADCVGCGIHIHAGTSCATHEEVLGHGWNAVVVQDLWTAVGGATYSTNSSGKARGFFELYNGFGYEENLNHAVVIHMQDGTRVGCGVLMSRT